MFLEIIILIQTYNPINLLIRSGLEDSLRIFKS